MRGFPSRETQRARVAELRELFHARRVTQEAAVPTARNSSYQEGQTKLSQIQAQLKSAEALLGLLDVLEEIREHPRVVEAHFVHAWLVSRGLGLGPVASTRGIRLVLLVRDEDVPTEHSEHELTFPDLALNANELHDVVFGLLDS